VSAHFLPTTPPFSQTLVRLRVSSVQGCDVRHELHGDQSVHLAEVSMKKNSFDEFITKQV